MISPFIKIIRNNFSNLSPSIIIQQMFPFSQISYLTHKQIHKILSFLSFAIPHRTLQNVKPVSFVNPI